MSQRIFDIRTKGEMTAGLSKEFEDVEVTIDRGVTRLRFVAGDTTVVHGILDRLESLGLELLDVHSVEFRPEDTGIPGSPGCS